MTALIKTASERKLTDGKNNDEKSFVNRDVKKIIIIGSSGAGKSTLARRLGEITGLEVIHLDVLHWKPNWTEPAKDEWQKTVENALQGDSWIIDGNFGGTMELRMRASDTVIFLDLPRTTCVYRILKRVVFYRKGRRPDMAEGCDEKFDWKFIKWVWNFPGRSRAKIENLLEKYGATKTIIRLDSKRRIEEFLSELAVKSG